MAASLTALVIPPAPSHRLGPRVEHFMIEGDVLLSAYLCEKLQLPEVRPLASRAPTAATRGGDHTAAFPRSGSCWS
jgi:hypothetical protein